MSQKPELMDPTVQYISDGILEIAELFNDVSTSDLQGLAQVKAVEILQKLLTETPCKDEPTVDKKEVFYWDSDRYQQPGHVGSNPFEMDVADHRDSSGQFYVDLAPKSGATDDILSVTMEVNRLPGGNDDMQCCHLNIDGDSLIASFFKQGDKLIVRPESGVTISNTVLPDGEAGWILE